MQFIFNVHTSQISESFKFISVWNGLAFLFSKNFKLILPVAALNAKSL